MSLLNENLYGVRSPSRSAPCLSCHTPPDPVSPDVPSEGDRFLGVFRDRPWENGYTEYVEVLGEEVEGPDQSPLRLERLYQRVYEES